MAKQSTAPIGAVLLRLPVFSIFSHSHLHLHRIRYIIYVP